MLCSLLDAPVEDRDKLIAVSSCKGSAGGTSQNNHLNFYHFLQDGLTGATASTWDHM